MTFQAFNALSPAALRALVDALHDGSLSHSVTHHPVAQIAGSHAGPVAAALNALQEQGFTLPQIALLVTAVAETRESIPDPSLVFELVLSGPPLATIPTRQTAAVVRTLFSDADEEVLVAGYAIHNGQHIFGPLHERMLAVPNLAVRLFFDIPRRDYQVDAEHIIKAFTREFLDKHWPWPELPHLYYYPRSLEISASERGSLHAKCVVIDRKAALVSSANFTEAAQHRNIEIGLLIRYSPMVTRLKNYFDSLVASGQLKAVPLTLSLHKPPPSPACYAAFSNASR